VSETATTLPLSDHEIAIAFAQFPETWSLVRACRELVVLRQLRGVVQEMLADRRMDLGDYKQRLEELVR